jgi:hypothetical protein
VPWNDATHNVAVTVHNGVDDAAHNGVGDILFMGNCNAAYHGYFTSIASWICTMNYRPYLRQ